MIIKIKRSTKVGLKETYGVLLEAHGYQFCLTDEVEGGLRFVIELSCGGSVYTIDQDLFHKCPSTKDLIRIAEDAINSKTKKQYDKRISYFIKTCKMKYGFEFPINNPVIPLKP